MALLLRGAFLIYRFKYVINIEDERISFISDRTV